MLLFCGVDLRTVTSALHLMIHLQRQAYVRPYGTLRKTNDDMFHEVNAGLILDCFYASAYRDGLNCYHGKNATTLHIFLTRSYPVLPQPLDALSIFILLIRRQMKISLSGPAPVHLTSRRDRISHFLVCRKKSMQRRRFVSKPQHA